METANAAPRQQDGITARVAARAIELRTGTLPAESRAVARHCILDWLGVALAASGEPLVRLLAAQVREEGCGTGAGILRHATEASPRQAALVNGAMGHALDYDDVHLGAQGHVTAATLPAALALAQATHASGEQLLRAFACGYEVMTMTGLYVGQPHYDQGFHATGTLGTFGAAAACATLLGLDETRLRAALGIAGSQAAGLKAQFGTMCKPLHAGKAAENGLLAAQLAARGFTSHLSILECGQGFGATLSPAVTPTAPLVRADGQAHLRDTLFKFDAACYGTHAPIAAARWLRDAHGLSADDIDEAHVLIEPTLARMCNIALPHSGLEAKFSVRFNVAMALAGEDTAHPGSYTDDVVWRDDLLRLCDRIGVDFLPAGSPRMYGEVLVHTRDGRHLSAAHDAGLPAIDLERQGEQVLHKFLVLATPPLGRMAAQELAGMVLNLESVSDVGDIMTRLR